MTLLAWLAAAVTALAGAGGQSQPAPADALVGRYCVSCHGEKKPAGGLTLVGFDATRAVERAEVAERIIRKLRAGMMPPPGEPRPGAETIAALVADLESRLDAAAAANPNPGWRPSPRLSRAEYARAIRDLLGLDLDVAGLLPPDTMSAGFDNVADVQTFSPALTTGYLRAASRISRQAVTDPASRARLFTCRATTDACAATIVSAVAKQAFRGRGTAEDVADAMTFYRRGRASGGFDEGIRLALQSMLVNPRFLFRLEPPSLGPTGGPSFGAPGSSARATVYAIDDLALASRLSFFLWGAAPDEPLLTAATAGALRTPAGLERETRRLLRDPRAEALGSRFAAAWLRLQDLEKMVPDPRLFPEYDVALATAMRHETERFFTSIVSADRSVLDLLTADSSFVNERLARHYGIPNVAGPELRPTVMPEARRGLLGQGSILALTSVADRTSPVLRGKWVMEVLLGTPPPPPPPNVPALDDSVKATRAGTRLSTRQRMEEHRKRPSCNACHRYIDPLGLALENFDAIGAWRTTDNSVPVDAVGELYDGTRMDGPAGLRQALLNHQDLVLRTFTENLMTYALNRRVEYTDMPAVRTIVRDAERQGNRVSAFVLGIVRSDAFRMAAGRPS